MTHKQQAMRVFEAEAQAVRGLADHLDGEFDVVVEKILACEGKVIVCGMGKSGLIGQKISATLSSTGTPSHFLHPAEAWHGDLGMVSKQDIFIGISNSGESEEVLGVLPFLRNNGNTIVAMTGNAESTLARNAHYHLSIAVSEEACPLDLAPTASTTATLAMGDALAVALMVARQFQPEDFARFHPGGSLGRRLLTKVEDLMRKDDLPILAPDASAMEVIQVATRGRIGIAIVMEQDKLIGVITDGDLRRGLERFGEQFVHQDAAALMTREPKTIAPDASVQEATELMNRHSITVVLVHDGEALCGALQLYQCEL